MKKIIHLLCCIISIASFGQKQKSETDKRFAGLDTAFARVLKDWHAPGFAIAVVEKNKIVYAKGFGYRDFGNKIPVTPGTLFAIGSCTKAFTSALLGILRRDGKLDFDKPVRDYLPELKFYNNELNDKITLRDMMCHRTGLPRHDLSWYYFTTPSRDSLVQRIQYLEPSAGLREKWQYNNFMFMAQGVTAEKLTHKSWEENIRENIFQPLNMSHSVFSIEDLIKSNEAAIGYNLINDSIIRKTDYFHIDAMGPAGSINSSVTDMSNWVITWINHGKFNGKEILPEGYVSEAMSPQMSIGSGTEFPSKEHPEVFFSEYGFGWILSSYNGHYRVMHGGNIDGFSASTTFFPTDSIGIIVLVNQSNSSVPSIVRNLVADRMLKLKYFDWNTDLKKADEKLKAAQKEGEKTKISNRKQNTKPSHELKDYAGLYKNNGYGIFEVSLLHDSLFLFIGKHTMWLRHYHYDIFEPLLVDPETGIDTSDNGNPLQFQMNISGEIESALFAVEPALKDPIAFTKIPKPKELGKDDLKKYAGEYDLNGITAKVYLKNDKTLFLLVPGQPEYELVPIENNKFNIKSLNGFSIQFNLNDKKEVTELLSIQPNGTYKATRKK